MRVRVLIWALLMGLFMFFTACAGPKLVVRATGTEDQMKMMYAQYKQFLFVKWIEEGVVKCEVEDDGSLTNCHEMELVFEE